TDEEKIVSANGIYAVYADVLSHAPGTTGSSHPPFTIIMDETKEDHSRLKGMMSIGFRPTVDGKKRVIEVNIFDFDKDIYGQTLRVYMKKYLRPEVKFNDLDELVKQIDQDKIESLKIL